MVMNATEGIAVGMLEGKVVMTAPLQSGKGEVVDPTSVEMNGEIVLSGYDAFHPDVMIRTTKGEIEECMEAIDTPAKVKFCFRESWDRIKNVNSNMLYKEGGKKWQNFLSNIISYYCARFKLFGKPMPAVCEPEVKEMCEKIGDGNAIVNFSKNTVISKK